jgi:hypothetical protein
MKSSADSKTPIVFTPVYLIFIVFTTVYLWINTPVLVYFKTGMYPWIKENVKLTNFVSLNIKMSISLFYSSFLLKLIFIIQHMLFNTIIIFKMISVYNICPTFQQHIQSYDTFFSRTKLISFYMFPNKRFRLFWYKHHLTTTENVTNSSSTWPPTDTNFFHLTTNNCKKDHTTYTS